MKTIYILLFVSLLLPCTLPVVAQNTGIHGDVIAAIKQANAGKLAPHLGANVELNIGNKNDIYSKQQTVEIVSDFFRNNTVNDFEILHSGTKDISSFVIGTLKTSTGTYRVYILTRKVDGKSVVQQLRIEPSNE